MSKEKDTAVNFENPESLESELAAEVTETPVTAKKATKPAKPRKIKVTFTADKDIAAGEVITFDYELPKSAGIRGVVSGIALEEMTDDQLKIEYRNANSVYYKTKKAGKDFSASEKRLNAVKAVMEKKGIQPTARATAAPITPAAIAEAIKNGSISVDEIQAFLTGTK